MTEREKNELTKTCNYSTMKVRYLPDYLKPDGYTFLNVIYFTIRLTQILLLDLISVPHTIPSVKAHYKISELQQF